MAFKDKQLVGAAGEHLVLSRLLTRGYLVAQAPRGVRKAINYSKIMIFFVRPKILTNPRLPRSHIS